MGHDLPDLPDADEVGVRPRRSWTGRAGIPW
jgi:hypothetical protein